MAAILHVLQPGDVSSKQILITAAIADFPVTIKVSNSSEPAVKASPFGTLPILELPSGQLVHRTTAIVRYLSGLRLDSTLYGRTMFEEAQIDQWVDASADISTAAALISTLHIHTLPQSHREQSVGTAGAALDSILSLLESKLVTQTFLVGERLSLADVVLVTTLQPLFEKAIDASSRSQIPHTLRWFLTCANQASFKAILGPVALRGDAAPAGGAGGPAGGAGGGGAKEQAYEAAQLVPAVVGSGAASFSAPAGLFRRHRVRVKELLTGGSAAIGTKVTVSGWVRTLRAQASFSFLSVNDGSCLAELQLLLSKGGDFVTEGYDEAIKTTTGCSVSATGLIVASPKPNQPVEMQVHEIKVIGWCDATVYPMSKKKHTLEHLRLHQHLRMRTNLIGAATRVRDACAFAAHKFFNERGFLYIHTPLITASDCEGAGEMFQVTTLIPDDVKADLPRTKDGSIDYDQDFFKSKANLTVSGQLQVECFSVSMCDVYTFGPTFRAEKSDTYRHLAEFWMIEPEICFADVFDDMNLAEDFIRYVVSHVLATNAEDIAFFNDFVDPEKKLLERLNALVTSPFERITYTEAVELLLKPENLKKGKFKEKPYWGIDLASEHERFITESIFHKPVFIRDYPKEIKSFYMKLNPDGKTVAAMDLIVPGIGELIGGSQREDNFELLASRIKENGMELEPYQWYLDLRRFGSAPHAGFGVGFERLIMYLTSIQNIRDVIPFPRYYHGRADV